MNNAATSHAATSLDTVPQLGNSTVISLLYQVYRDDLAKSVSACCREWKTLCCPEGHVLRPTPVHRCYFRLCEHCARARQSRAFGRCLPKLQTLERQIKNSRWVFLTLTVKSSDDCLLPIIKRFKAAFTKLRRRQVWRDSFSGAVSGYEVTYNPEHGWHFHAHILALRFNWLDQKLLASEWAACTGEEMNVVDIRAVKNVESALTEVLKYCFKPASLEQWGWLQMHDFLRCTRLRWAETFGDLRGIKIDDDLGLDDPIDDPDRSAHEGEPCPICGETLTFQRLNHFVVVTARQRIRELLARPAPTG